MIKTNESYEYHQVNSVVKSDDEKGIVWKPLLRQLLVCSGIWNSFLLTGLSLGTPTVLIPQLRREANSTDAVSDEMASWISSIHGYAGIPWVLLLPVLSGQIGRRYPYFIVSISSLVSFVLLYCSTTVTHILIAEIIQGGIFASQITISIIIITEYTSPKYRGIFLTLKSASLNWGMWVGNALGTFFHWKTIAMVGMVLSIYNLTSTLLWCESPYWLASKYRFEDCAKAHRWLKGEDPVSERELELLIKSYKEDIEDGVVKKVRNVHDLIKNMYRTLTQKAFYKPLLICLAIMSLYHLSGKLVCSMYALDIIKKITSTESIAYMGMLLLDGVSVMGMYIGCGLSKILKRRTLLITGTCAGITFLFLLSLYLFLVNLSVIKENNYVSLGLLTVFSFSISCGPIIMSTSIYGELIPTRFETLCMLVTGLYTLIIMATFLRLGPLIFKTFQLSGAFLFYGILSSAVIFLMYKVLPETKDKTLQEIENCFSNSCENSSKKADKLIN